MTHHAYDTMMQLCGDLAKKRLTTYKRRERGPCKHFISDTPDRHALDVWNREDLRHGDTPRMSGLELYTHVFCDHICMEIPLLERMADPMFHTVVPRARRGRATAANAAAVAEKKVSILSKALEHHPGNTQLLLVVLEVRVIIGYCLLHYPRSLYSLLVSYSQQGP